MPRIHNLEPIETCLVDLVYFGRPDPGGKKIIITVVLKYIYINIYIVVQYTLEGTFSASFFLIDGVLFFSSLSSVKVGHGDNE